MKKKKTYLISLAYEVDSHALSETYFLHLNSRTPHKEMLKIVFEEDLHSDQFFIQNITDNTVYGRLDQSNFALSWKEIDVKQNYIIFIITG